MLTTVLSRVLQSLALSVIAAAILCWPVRAEESLPTVIIDSTHGDFVATFRLGAIPQPLVECPVTLELQYRPKNHSVNIRDEAASFRITAIDGRVQLTGDTVIVWQPPIAEQSIRVATFGFVPRYSGLSWIIVDPGGPPIGEPLRFAPRLAYCIDEEGQPQFVGVPQEEERIFCSSVNTYFFDSDSLRLVDPVDGLWQAVFKPTPKIRDTCSVRLTIFPPDDWLSGATIDISSGGFLIGRLPTAIGPGTRSGEKVILDFSVVPDSGLSRKSLEVQFLPDLSRVATRSGMAVDMMLCFWFGAGQTLVYVGNQTYPDLSEKAGSHRTHNWDRALESYRISPDGQLIQKHGNAKPASEPKQ